MTILFSARLRATFSSTGIASPTRQFPDKKLPILQTLRDMHEITNTAHLIASRPMKGRAFDGRGLELADSNTDGLSARDDDGSSPIIDKPSGTALTIH